MNCRKCVFFIPHDTFEYLGICDERNELVVSTPQTSICDNYREVTLEKLKKILEERGWLRCVSCQKAIYTVSELEEHLEDILVPSTYADNVASEEAPTG